MIVTRKKPIEEVMALIADAKTVALVGCGSCATACHTGGQPEIDEMTKLLQAAGKTVVASAVCDYCCMNLGVKSKMKSVLAANPDCVLAMSCGDGVQCIAKNAGNIPVYPTNNTMFLGEATRFGVWKEACHLCGDCVLGKTGGICPISQCAKSLVNGPCGGQKNGKCEVNPENDCAWIKIYNRLLSIGQLEKLDDLPVYRDHRDFTYPKTVRLKGESL